MLYNRWVIKQLFHVCAGNIVQNNFPEMLRPTGRAISVEAVLEKQLKSIFSIFDEHS